MTTTAERLRSYWGERQIGREQLGSFAVRYWQIALIVALVGLAAGLRLWDLGERAIHHDESIHIKFAYDITQGSDYTHDPVYHGPLQYFGMAATFVLFGDSDYTSRLFPALFGIALVGLPFLLRRQLGTAGTFAAAGLLALSPTLLYFSRFARNDIYVAFFTLAIVVCIWRYLAERRDGWLIAIAPLLALSFAAKEVTPIIVAILVVFLNTMLATELVQQLRASRRMSPLETALAYAVVIPTAWAIVALWPVSEGLRRRLSLSEMPAAGALLIVFGTLAAPQFAAAVQKLPFIDDKGYMAETDVMRVTVLVLVIGSAYVGLLWNWRVWLWAAGLFYATFFLLFTSFFTNGGDIWNIYTFFTTQGGGFLHASGDFWRGEGGFWTGIWGSMDYWLQQQFERRGNQPEYYYFVLLPVYEFLPLVFALGGTLYYAFRGKLEHRLLAASALLLVIVFSLMPADTPLIGPYRVQAAFVIVIGAVLLLSMEGFTKFLLFWMLSILFGLTVAGEKMPWLTVHLALPLALLAAKVLDDVLSTGGERVTAASSEGEAPPAQASSEGREPREAAMGLPLARPAALLAGAGLAVVAAALFQAFGPASGISVVPWLLSVAGLAVVVWAGATVSWRAAGQVVAVALFAALIVFTVRAGGTAAFDQGSPDSYPPELFIYAQGSPGLGVIRDGIDELARDSGRGRDLKIVIDNSGGQNIWPWPWYLRHYRNVSYTGLDPESEFTPEPGSVVLIRSQNQHQMQPFMDQFQEGIPYTHMWWFPELYRRFNNEEPTPGRFLSDFFQGRFLSTWRGYFIDRTVPGATASANMVAYFPEGFGEIDVPVTPKVPGSANPLPAESLTIVGGPGDEPGEFSQPADLAVDEEGNLYIVDTLNHRVQKFSPDGAVTTLGEAGDGPGQFGRVEEPPDGPWGIGIDGEGNIYVADTWSNFGRIQKFGPDLEFILEWGTGEFFGPRDVTIDGDGNVLVVDTGNKRIVKYDPEGTMIAEYGVEGSREGQFKEPSSISVAPSGDIYVADFWNQRIQHFNPAFEYVDEISVDTWGSRGVTDRAYIAALPDGRVLATDPANGRILVFDQSGEEEAAWSLPTSIGRSRPVGITVDAQGWVYISDGLASEVRRVSVLVLLAPPTP